MPGVEKKVRKLLPEPKPQPKEEVVLKSGIVFFNCFVSFKFTKKKKKIDLKAYKNISVSWFSFNRITYLSKFIDSCTENWEGYHFHSFF